MAFSNRINVSSRYTTTALVDGNRVLQGPDFPYSTLLPGVKHFAARTIGFDLVSVQPLSQPIGNLQYIDKYNNWKNHTFTVDEFFNDNNFDDY